jgi:endonuclease YncB( thermonuclease family)
VKPLGQCRPQRAASVVLPGRRACLLVGVSLVVGVESGLAASMEAKVVGVTDGDTLEVLDGRKTQHKVRLAGIDAPERRQAFGARAHQTLAAAVFSQRVVLDWHKKDRYGRLVAKVMLAGRDVGLGLVSLGLAWHYKAYEQEQTPADRARYAAAELEARRSSVGLWSMRNPTPPWDFRGAP